MKVQLILLASLLLSACSATTRDQQNLFDDKTFTSTTGKEWTVNKLRSDFFERTGKPLTGVVTSQCGWDGDCYYNKWASAYDDGINKYLSESNRKADEAAARCDSDPRCVEARELKKEMTNLANQYRFIMHSHPYEQADYDAAIRLLCEKSSAAHKAGISKKGLLDGLRDAPGVSPGDREQFLAVASSCWTIVDLNGEWKESLRGIY